MRPPPLTHNVFNLVHSEGAFCESPGEPWDGQACDFFHSTCGNKTQDCHGRCAPLPPSHTPCLLMRMRSGPGFRISDFESNRIIAQRQVDGAKTIMSQTLPAVSGAVKYVHTYMNMYVVVCCSGCSLSTDAATGRSANSSFPMARPRAPARPLWVAHLLVAPRRCRAGLLAILL